jgi:Ca2+-binding EF-hand superfamily protein
MLVLGSGSVAAAETIELTVVGDAPTQWTLRVTRDGESTQQRWQRVWRALFVFYDTDADGWLDEDEAQHLPHPLELHRILAGQFSYGTPLRADWSQADRNNDQRMDAEELGAFYGGGLLGEPVIGLGEFPFADLLNEALLQTLDTDGDGQLSRGECDAADAVLAPLDTNGDELVGPGELATGIAYPATAGTTMLPAGDGKAAKSGLLRRFPLRRRAMTQDKQPNQQTPAMAASAEVPAAEWNIDVRGGATEPGRPQRLVIPGLRLQLSTRPGRLPGQLAAFRDQVESVFRDADADGNEELDADETGDTQKPAAERLLREADRNRDGVLARGELDAWLRTRERIADACVLLTVIDFGAGLFECLDVDHDGGLSPRERRNVWRRLVDAGHTRDNRVALEMLPRQLLATASAGHPKRFLAAQRSGPSWFRNMDRNGDGDVSADEFIGPLATFQQLDRNRDGLLDAAEAGKLPPATR